MSTKKEEVREYYETFADVYDTKHGVKLYGQAYNFRTYYAPFLDAAVLEKGRVLELGCGAFHAFTEFAFPIPFSRREAAQLFSLARKSPRGTWRTSGPGRRILLKSVLSILPHCLDQRLGASFMGRLV